MSPTIPPFTITGYYGSFAYDYCTREWASYPSTVNTLLFEPLDDFGYAGTNGGFSITGYHGTENDLVFPSEFLGKPVVAVSDNAFYADDTLHSVAFPNTIIRIGNNAFAYCEALTSITAVGDSDPAFAVGNVNYIGQNAFRECHELEPDCLYLNANQIKNNAFTGVPVKGVVVYNRTAELSGSPFGYVDQHDGTFTKYPGFTVTGFSNTTAQTYAENNSFPFIPLDGTDFTYEINGGEATVTGYNLDEKAVTVPLSFEGCPVVEIAPSVFSGKRMNSVKLPCCLERLRDSAFRDCKNLVKVEYYDAEGGTRSALRMIERKAFSGCTSLMYYRVFRDSDRLEVIGDYAFENCVSFGPVYGFHFEEIPETVTYIGEGAFIGCIMNHAKIFNRKVVLGDYCIGFKYDENGDPQRSLYSESVMTVYCFENSTAHRYCDTFGLTARFMKSYGDVNHDFDVTIDDVTAMQKYIAKLTDFDDYQMSVADMNNDKKINIIDATIIQKVLAGIKDYKEYFEPKG